MKSFLLFVVLLTPAFGQWRPTLLSGVGVPTMNCSVSQQFFQTNATAGANLWLCTATNVWTQISVSAGYDGGATGAVVVNNSAVPPTVDVDTAVVPLLAGGNAWAGTNSWTPTTNQAITAVGDAVLCNGNVVQVTPNASLTLTSTPTIANATANGTICIVTNLSTTYSLTLQDGATLSGSNLRLSGGASHVLLPLGSLMLEYNSTVGDWVQVGGPGRRVVQLGGYEVGAENAAAALVTADLTNHAFIVNDANAKTLVEASCISDAGDQEVTVKISSTTLFSIHCVGPGTYSASTTDGSTGYIIAASMSSTAVGVHTQLDLSGTANTTTKDVKLHVYATVN
jgi:hypothetical protein